MPRKIASFAALTRNYLSNTHALDEAMQVLKNMRDNRDYKKAFKQIDNINNALAQIRKQYNHDHNRYVWIMKRNYDINKKDELYQVGDLVAYYIGDRARTNQKLQARFSGPWVITKLGKNSAKIVHKETGESMVSHFKMLKLWNEGTDFTPLALYERTEIQKDKLRQYRRVHTQKRKQESKPIKKQTIVNNTMVPNSLDNAHLDKDDIGDIDDESKLNNELDNKSE